MPRVKVPIVTFEKGNYCRADQVFIRSIIQKFWKICRKMDLVNDKQTKELKRDMDRVRFVNVESLKESDRDCKAVFIPAKSTTKKLTMRVSARTDVPSNKGDAEIIDDVLHELIHAFYFIDGKKKEIGYNMEELVVNMATKEAVRMLKRGNR